MSAWDALLIAGMVVAVLAVIALAGGLLLMLGVFLTHGFHRVMEHITYGRWRG